MIRTPAPVLLAATCIAALLAMPGFETPLGAQGNCPRCDLPPGCRGKGNQKPGKKPNRNCQRIEIAIDSDVDFGRLVLLGDGEAQVVLDLATGEKVLIGDIDDLGGMPVTGRAIVTGAPREEVLIDLPGEVALRDPAGGEALMRAFETDLPARPVLDSGGRLEFGFSGTLVIEADKDASGTLRGRVPIAAQYP